MLVLALSDLHLSRYGETGVWTQRDDEDGRWEEVHAWQGWSIDGLRDKKGRPDKLRLVDPSGVIHKRRGWPKRDDKAVGALLALAMERHLTSADHLIRQRPEPADLASLLRVDRHNTNLLFLRLLDQLQPLQPDVILITGDITDNGFGYELVCHYFADWIADGRLLAIPGNHDIYDMFPRKGRRKRAQAKADRYRVFGETVDLEPVECGAWLRRVGDVAFVGLNSCKPPITPLSASGLVTEDQLQWLTGLEGEAAFAGARLRVGLVHHHLLRMPFELGKRSPIEVGLRLRNAAEVMEACKGAGIDLLFNGHRHHGYAVQLPGHPMVISSPSSTLGCKSTDLQYVWLIDLDAARPFPMHFELSAEANPLLEPARGRGRARLGT